MAHRGGPKYAIDKSNVADGRHLVKYIHLNISAMGWPISTKFCMVVHMGTPERTVGHIFQISKIQDGGDRHLEISEYRRISKTVQDRDILSMED